MGSGSWGRERSGARDGPPRADHTAASIRLETFWNEIARAHRFCLLCCYLVGDLDEASYASALEGIGPTYSDVLPTPDQPHSRRAAGIVSESALARASSKARADSIEGNHRERPEIVARRGARALGPGGVGLHGPRGR